jgi:hypothetical protein
MKKIFKLFAISLVIFSINTFAKSLVPIIDHTDVQLHSFNNKTLSVDQVRKAIVLAGAKHTWDFESGDSENSLVGTLVVRGKHTVVIDIKIEKSSLSITYKNSVNLNFKELNGKKLIHPNYNKWIQDLITNIRAEASNLEGVGI